MLSSLKFQFDFWQPYKHFNFPYCSLQRLPFDHKTPTRYILTVAAQAAGGIALLLCATVLIGFLIGSCWSFISFVDDIAIEMFSLRLDDTSNIAQQREIKERFSHVMQLYVDVKQLSSECLSNRSTDCPCTTIYFHLI